MGSEKMENGPAISNSPRVVSEKPTFNIDRCFDYVEDLIRHDEVERALLVLDNVPALYRDQVPAKLAMLRYEIQKARYTVHAYIDSDLDATLPADDAVATLRHLLRGRLAEAEVKRYNEQNVIPHIVDMGPGGYIIPIALRELGYRFTYWDVALNARARDASRELPRLERAADNQPIIFLALEVIEHMPDPTELAVEAYRQCGRSPERIHLSTPLYTYDTAHADWRTAGGLPHLRAYTPAEFFLQSQRIFPGYEWAMLPDQIMSLRGQRRDVVDHQKIV